MRAAHALLRTALSLTAAGLTAGCVTEVVPVSPKDTSPAAGVPVTPPVATATPGNATVTTRVAAAIKPLGSVPYDGLTLPLVSTDGRFVVTQIGALPPWEAVLAEPGAAPVPANAVAAFEVNAGALRRVDWAPGASNAPSAATGLLLGRCAGDSWVLVERPNDDGSRWIGRLDLHTGEVTWLVQGTDVNAHALLLRDGTLVYTRRAVREAPAALIFQPAAAQDAPAPTPRTVRREGWRLCQPVATPDQSIVAVLAIGPVESELLAYSTTHQDAAGAPLLVGRATLGPMSAAAAFQAVTPVEACPPPVQADQLASTILLVNADRRRLCLWDPVRGTTTMLPATVMAAARTKNAVASGMVLSSARGTDLWSGGAAPARLVAGSYIPRSYAGQDGTHLILLSPQTDSAAPALRVLGVELVVPNP